MAGTFSGLGTAAVIFPFEDNRRMPKDRVVMLNDHSVPPKKNHWSFNQPFSLLDDYPEHTRVVHHSQTGVCALAYAGSQHGAQKMLRELALKPVTEPIDILFRFHCEGTDGRKKQWCITVNSTLFSHHRTVGLVSFSSNIGDHGDGYRHEAMTDIIRFSVRLNAESILNGSTTYTDQFADQ